MISIDKGLLGQGQLGDVVERHAKYGRSVERLDIIIFALKGSKPYKVSSNVTAYPTNSASKLMYGLNAKKVGEELFKKNNYDLIVTQDPFITGFIGVLLKAKFKAKLLVHFHGDFWENPGWLKESKLNWLYLIISKFVVSRSDAVRVMSSGRKDKLVKAGIAEEKIRVISTPVDINKYDQQSEISSQKSGAIVLHVGRNSEEKDYQTLGRAWGIVSQKFPQASFVQVGAGEAIKEFFKNIKVQFNKIISQRDLVDYYHQASVVVLSSRSESFGKVLVEANACGKPVVSTATTGAQEIIKDGYNGFLVPIGDANSLADKILELLNDPVKAQAMGENGGRLVQEKFSDNTEKIISYWKEIIK